MKGLGGQPMTTLLFFHRVKSVNILFVLLRTRSEVEDKLQLFAKVDFKAEGDVPSTFHGQWATTGDKVHLY